MSKLSRQPDGSYSGTYKGHEFTVCKETVEERGRTETHWVARSGTHEYRSKYKPSLDDAVRGLRQEIDMSLVSVPEIDTLLKRWSEEIKAIVPLLDDRDRVARMQLQELRYQLDRMDAEVRLRAVRFEEKLSSLKDRMQHALDAREELRKA